MSPQKPADFLAQGWTPMMAQYLALRARVEAEHPGALLLYRIGEFYELLGCDAEAAAPALGLALTSRGRSPDGRPIPLAGVPAGALDAHLPRLLAAGWKVAIGEEGAEAAPIAARCGRPGKALRARTISRVLTPGTAVEALDPLAPTPLAVVTPTEVAWCDAATGALFVESGEAEAILARLAPAEVVETPSDALSALRDYLARTTGAAQHLAPARRMDGAAFLDMDVPTRRALEVTRTLSGARKGSLLHAIDVCVTPAGRRALATDLSGPLTDVARINARLDRVAALVADEEGRGALRARLREAPDMARTLGRLAAGRWAPADLLALRNGLITAGAVCSVVYAAPPLAEAFEGLLRDLAAGPSLAPLAQALKEGVAEDGAIAPGFAPALDAARGAQERAEAEVAGLQAAWRTQTGIARLRVAENVALGHFVEVPARVAGPLMAPGSGFTHRQTLAGAVRFTRPELVAVSQVLADARARAAGAEREAQAVLVARALDQAQGVRRVAEALARLDVAAGLADIAARKNWSRPVVEDSAAFVLEGARHPVLDGPDFVANDCDLARMTLVTGPNMGGKSTFLRQAALITILAQAGAFVPAHAAKIGVADRLFARVGSADDLAAGRSTFLVEMEEVAAILRNATARSLVILDEIGRGTATFDGLAIAWACLEALAQNAAPRALLSTHYHELTALPFVANRHMAAEADGEGLRFLYKAEDGPASGSFGLVAARLAGVPEDVLARARGILGALESGAPIPPRY
ncbi:MAG TPA: DNA mismatch repair protein MutS [Rhodospirillaceae bacterium]|nr:DNA mismatch repair protein MutS [Alphaproteobacteria bacterium]HBH26587.1 DNA mismatch repair protein MutS [Rhodospirillaceae bacterium]